MITDVDRYLSSYIYFCNIMIDFFTHFDGIYNSSLLPNEFSFQALSTILLLNYTFLACTFQNSFLHANLVNDGNEQDVYDLGK